MREGIRKCIVIYEEESPTRSYLIQPNPLLQKSTILPYPTPYTTS